MSGCKHTNPVHPRARGAFTLAEILVVLAIFTLLLLLGVPAVRSLLASSEASLAENQLRVGLTAARDAAIRSEKGDAAAVFFYDNGRTVIVPCVSVGVLEGDERWVNGAVSGANPTAPTGREVFVPVSGVEPVRMPRGWNVRGYSAPGSISTGIPASEDGWYDCASMDPSVNTLGNWVFPETSFYDQAVLTTSMAGSTQGWKRQTFFVRFEAQTGNTVMNAAGSALVVDPLNAFEGAGFRSQAPFNVAQNDITQAATIETFVRQCLARAELRQGVNPALRRLLGDQSPDTVLARPVTELALYEEQKMASAIGAGRLNAATQTVYGAPGQRNAWPTQPEFDFSLFAAGVTAGDVQTRINAYINRRNDLLPGNDVALEARIFTMQRYMGQIQELSAEVGL